ncbi:MAG: DUF1207 domain-containing protein [Planctomycetales bacterium]|nr:DUF1207 domain-containing protein [Planctomycetales bacterium]
MAGHAALVAVAALCVVAAQAHGQTTFAPADVGNAVASDHSAFDQSFDWSATDAWPVNGPSPVPAMPRLAAAGPPYQLLDPHVSVSPSGFAPGPYTNAPPLSPEPSAFNPLLNEFRAPPPQMVRHQPGGGPWTWQLLPDGLMYRSYLAGVREPRFGGVWNYERDIGWIWDIALGGRAGIIRYGTTDPFHPEGWQLDIEGAGFPRLDLEDENDLVSVDFRFGVPLTYRVGRFQSKFGFYHLSSHLGDEFLETHPDLTRINYSRDVLVLGVGWFFTPSLRGYAEAGYAFHSDVGLEWEFQFGFDYSPAYPTGPRGAPFFAVNAHLREEVDFGGEFVAQVGWQWRGAGAGHLFRIGAQYFNGMSEQYEFITDSESKIGMGIWYDF